MLKKTNNMEADNHARSNEEYLGAFTESLKMIMHQNPVERMGNAVLLAAKTALRIKAANPQLREQEITNWLQTVARNIRLTTILNDLTPEEKNMLKLHAEQTRVQGKKRKTGASAAGTPKKALARSRA